MKLYNPLNQRRYTFALPGGWMKVKAIQTFFRRELIACTLVVHPNDAETEIHVLVTIESHRYVRNARLFKELLEKLACM